MKFVDCCKYVFVILVYHFCFSHLPGKGDVAKLISEGGNNLVGLRGLSTPTTAATAQPKRQTSKHRHDDDDDDDDDEKQDEDGDDNDSKKKKKKDGESTSGEDQDDEKYVESVDENTDKDEKKEDVYAGSHHNDDKSKKSSKQKEDEFHYKLQPEFLDRDSPYRGLHLLPELPKGQFPSVRDSIDPQILAAYDRIDNEDPQQRCKRYGLKVDPARVNNPRRIFFGALVASENEDIFKLHATEAYGIYESVSLVESNYTFKQTPKSLRFPNGWNQNLSSLFDTDVYVGHFTNRLRDEEGMVVETVQRDYIRQRWIREGMRPDDIGIVSDIDEVATRSVLRAIQTCRFAQFDDDSCRVPKVFAETLVFESSPNCMRTEGWYHPDFVAGRCIQGVGDESDRKKVERDWLGQYGGRPDEDDDNAKPPKSPTGKYPLLNAEDIRTYGDAQQIEYRDKPDEETTTYATGYHFHNFFSDLSILRNKYLTYGHFEDKTGAGKDLLSMIDEDIDVAVRCVHGIPNKARPPSEWVKPWFEQGYERVEGEHRPLYFLNPGYRERRHAQLVKAITDDEAIHGRSYTKDGEWVGDNKRLPSWKWVWGKILESDVVSDFREINEKAVEKMKSGSTATTNGKDVSATATVIGLGDGEEEDDDVHKFVWTLLASGYKGYIILGLVLKADAKEALKWFEHRQDQILVRWLEDTGENIYTQTTEWLESCKACNGPVLLTSLTNTYFQANPFGAEAPEISGLQVFEEHPNIRTKFWVLDNLYKKCLGEKSDRPDDRPALTLSAAGSLSGMKTYLATMASTINEWKNREGCQWEDNAGEKAIASWVVYKGELKDVVTAIVPNRAGVIHVVGHEVDGILRAHEDLYKQWFKVSRREAKELPLLGATSKTWLGPKEFGLTDSEGFFVNFDKSRSIVVSEWEAGGDHFASWMEKQKLFSLKR